LKIYLDTSVINVFLFGRYSDTEKPRLPATKRLFSLMDEKHIDAVISLYSIQEVFSFCKKIFASEAGHVARLALSELFMHNFELSGLLTRQERLLNRTRFNMPDLSDQPHAISAFLNKCDALVTYDTHFQHIKGNLSVLSPEHIKLK